jgi:hypothetical protein
LGCASRRDCRLPLSTSRGRSRNAFPILALNSERQSLRRRSVNTRQRNERNAHDLIRGDVFVHRTDLPANAGALYEGRPVSFEIDRTHRGLCAINIAFE